MLPIIFLRFLSLRFEHRREELEGLVRDESSEYFGDDAALDYPEEYRSVGAFILPSEARWENIVRIAQVDDIKVRLDNILDLLEQKYPDQLRGLLPPVYAGSNLSRENVTGLINLFSKDLFRLNHKGEDLIGRVYEYFIGEFASSEGKRGGEYFTPASIVRTLVAMLEPDQGVVFDPCCGSGGMFVQSDIFTKHSQQLSFFGQESKDFTYRLCRMNLFIHGLDGNIQLGNSYYDDKHSTLRADYVIANPPFNDGAKGEHGWGAQLIQPDDPRLAVGGHKMPLSTRNANTMWMLHFLHHLKEGGTAGFVMATGELSNGEVARLEVRKSLVERNHVDCIVQLPGQLFANTPIPCSLWFLSKGRDGDDGFRRRNGEILFIDARKLGKLIPGSRKQKELLDQEIERIAGTYRDFRRGPGALAVPGFSAAASFDQIRSNSYALTPGRYVGADELGEEAEDFERRARALAEQLESQFAASAALEREIRRALSTIGHGS